MAAFRFVPAEEYGALGAERLLARGASLFVVTRGGNGVRAWHRNAGMIEVKAPAVEVVDTIGAGDSFQAALLFALARLKRIERARLQSIDAEELDKVLSFACQCAALTCTRAGADPPRIGEVVAVSAL